MKNTLLMAFLTLLIFTTNTLTAQFWMESSNELGANQLAMADDSSIYFLAGANYLFKSEDDGNINSWNPVVGFPNENNYNILTKNEDIYLVNYTSQNTYDGKGVFKSSDGGQTWNQKNNGLGSDTNVMRIHELSNDVLMIETRPDQNTRNLYRSVNNGDTWNFVQSIDGYSNSVTLTSNGDWFMCGGWELYKSVDNGLSWSTINSTSQTGPSGFYHIIELDNGNLMLFGLYDIMESSDGGISFTNKSTNGLPDLNLTVNVNVIYPQGKFFDGAIYTSFNNDHGIFRSVDNGDNWTNIDYNLPTGYVFPKYLGLSKSGYLFASVSGEGVFRSTDPITGSAVDLTENKNKAIDIQIFPNPTQDLITVSLDESNVNLNIEVTDLQGKLVYKLHTEHETQFKFEIEGAPGIYLVNIYSDKFSYTEKIVKK
jgi:photosystem II stability/assembly factor-like uncharacterized protein